jgi:hypothetical protein
MRREDGSISFYFFDFDDNSMYLETPIFLRNTKTGHERDVSTTEFASIRGQLGNSGRWANFEIFNRTYSHFRDLSQEEKAKGTKEYFVQDIEKALEEPEEEWQAPAWSMLKYACEQQRPLAFVTARGHSRETIKAGVSVLVEKGHLPREPNYLEIYAVSNPDMVEELLSSVDDVEERERVRNMNDRTSALKRIAIRNIVDLALSEYGLDHDHRFGMSDDDPENVDLIIRAMCDAKKKHLDKRFFVINTHHGEHVKLEVFPVDFPVTQNAVEGEPIG